MSLPPGSINAPCIQQEREENSLWFRFSWHPGPEERHGDAEYNVDGTHVVGESEETDNEVQLRLRLKIVLFLFLLLIPLFIFTAFLLAARLALDGVKIVVVAKPSTVVRFNLWSDM